MIDLITHDLLDLTSPDVIAAKHSAWAPRLGAKFPFQWGGKVQAYKHPTEATYDLGVIGEEVALLRALAERQWGPPVGSWVFAKTVISEHPGYWWADPTGCVGYEVADVNTLPEEGQFSVDALRASGLVSGSKGAWNDISVPSRGNVQRGYLIDVARSRFDRLRFVGTSDQVPTFSHDIPDLVKRLHADGQFPFRERTHAYQQFYLAEMWWDGEREVVNRAKILGFDPQPGESVLDLGTCLGGFLQLAALAGAGPLVGLDAQPEFVTLARDVARASAMNICYRMADLRSPDEATVGWLRQVYPTGPDHLLMLSMGKHIGEPAMAAWIEALSPRTVYLESNACKVGDWPLRGLVERFGGAWIGDTLDRNLRRAYRIQRLVG